ncbi:MAG: hypothetical protein E6Q97_15425 [Desulfurellales bacterium]|nr:MAG: hypothetical protein E6Q97_15425 [Desulfurellales bacterium]
MTMPAFVSKGTAGTSIGDVCSGEYSVDTTLPGSINSGDVIVILFGGNGILSTIDSADTPSGYTAGLSTGIGTTVAAAMFYKVANGTEDSTTVTVSGFFGGSTAARVIAQSYVFSGSGTGGYHAVGGTNSGSSTTPSFASVTTTEANELAVGLMFAIVNTTVGDVTGETGGNWTEAAAEDTSSTRVVQCQTAQMASAGTISGGTMTLGTGGPWKTLSFALKEIVAGGGAPPPRDPLRPFQHLLIR